MLRTALWCVSKFGVGSEELPEGVASTDVNLKAVVARGLGTDVFGYRDVEGRMVATATDEL